MIEPDVDAYGSYARGSSLADYLELLAISGRRCTRAQLEDAVKDRYWSMKRSHMVVGSDDLDESGNFLDEESELLSHVDEAFECLTERVETLGDRYPFDLIDDNYLKFTAVDIEIHRMTYIGLLCVTMAHAYKVAVPGIDVPQLFEDIVAETLESRALLVSRVGERAREHGDFPLTLQAVGLDLQIPTLLSGSNFKRHANDMGADAIAHLHWHDDRRGRWTYVCQITCGDSDSWEEKMGQAAPGYWAGWFQDFIDPMCALAVPHHVPIRTFDLFTRGNRKIFLDRLRLTLARAAPSEAEVEVIRAVLEVGVENVAAA